MGLISCSKPPTPIAPKPEVCNIPSFPVVPQLEGQVCTIDGVQFACIEGPSAYALGTYLEEVERYHSDVMACPYVKEIIIAPTDLTPAVEAGKQLIK